MNNPHRYTKQTHTPILHAYIQQLFPVRPQMVLWVPDAEKMQFAGLQKQDAVGINKNN